MPILLSFQRTITRYFDATHVTAKLKPTFISKVNTGVQLFAIGSSLGAPIWGYVGRFKNVKRCGSHFVIYKQMSSNSKISIFHLDHSALHGLWYLTGVTTLAAALSYVLQKDTYRIIKESGQRKKKTWKLDWECFFFLFLKWISSKSMQKCVYPKQICEFNIRICFYKFIVHFS